MVAHLAVTLEDPSSNFNKAELLFPFKNSFDVEIKEKSENKNNSSSSLV